MKEKRISRPRPTTPIPPMPYMDFTGWENDFTKQRYGKTHLSFIVQSREDWIRNLPEWKFWLGKLHFQEKYCKFLTVCKNLESFSCAALARELLLLYKAKIIAELDLCLERDPELKKFFKGCLNALLCERFKWTLRVLEKNQEEEKRIFLEKAKEGNRRAISMKDFET